MKKRIFFLIMWPSPFKLFLDTESEEDVVRNRAASSSEDGNSTASGADGGHQAEDDTSICPTVMQYSTSIQPPMPCEARIIRDKTRFDIAFSTPVARRRSSESVDLVRSRFSRLDNESTNENANSYPTKEQSYSIHVRVHYFILYYAFTYILHLFQINPIVFWIHFVRCVSGQRTGRE